MESFMIAGAMTDSQDDFLPFLQKLYDRALAARHAARADLDRTVLDGTKERTQFFEKLAIGSGATIAALVSFLGANDKRVLHPHWILRSALVALVVAMFTAMLRNYVYLHWAERFTNRVWLKKSHEELKARDNLYEQNASLMGKLEENPFDLGPWETGIPKGAPAQKFINTRVALDNRLKRAFTVAENVCLICIVVAIISLVSLALCNF
jgi:hypothetical protein